jgi:hypothetical protein
MQQAGCVCSCPSTCSSAHTASRKHAAAALAYQQAASTRKRHPSNAIQSKTLPPRGRAIRVNAAKRPRQLQGATCRQRLRATGRTRLRSTHPPKHAPHTPSGRKAPPAPHQMHQPQASSPPEQTQQPTGRAKQRTLHKTTCFFFLGQGTCEQICCARRNHSGQEVSGAGNPGQQLVHCTPHFDPTPSPHHLLTQIDLGKDFPPRV